MEKHIINKIQVIKDNLNTYANELIDIAYENNGLGEIDKDILYTAADNIVKINDSLSKLKGVVDHVHRKD